MPLRSGEDAIKVNYFRKTVIAYDHTGKQKYRRTSSWVTDLDVTADNIVLFTRGAKCRWKIENECFNTLKNQGYHLTHNYGHGEKHLAFNFYLLTLLAFTLHQIAELCDIAFKACRQMAGSKRSLWEKFRTIINIAVFENLEQFFNYFLDREAYNFTNGYAVKRPPP